MEHLVLLEKLRSLLKSAPPLEGRGPYGQEQFAWLGKAYALISIWNRVDAIAFGLAVDGMTRNFNRVANHGAVFTIIHKAIASVENLLPEPADQAFGPGAVYDFYRALREVVASADKSLFIVDPYLDAEIFDGYLCALPAERQVRLLFSRHSEDVRVAADKFAVQTSWSVEVRKSKAIHDRVIFVDDTQCWVLGASIKDAADKRPTYLAPLSADITVHKLLIYESIWHSATPI